MNFAVPLAVLVGDNKAEMRSPCQRNEKRDDVGAAFWIAHGESSFMSRFNPQPLGIASQIPFPHRTT